MLNTQKCVSLLIHNFLSTLCSMLTYNNDDQEKMVFQLEGQVTIQLDLVSYIIFGGCIRFRLVAFHFKT